MTREDLNLVLDAAERRAGELLNQAQGYYSRGQSAIAQKAKREHYDPLRKAIDATRAYGEAMFR